MHEEITSSLNGIYDECSAEIILSFKRMTPRKLSIMKQENIKEAIEKKMDIQDIKNAITQPCGYCLRYRKPGIWCKRCPVYRRLGKECTIIPEWNKMLRARTHKTLRKYHMEWCRKIGLDVYGKGNKKKGGKA